MKFSSSISLFALSLVSIFAQQPKDYQAPPKPPVASMPVVTLDNPNYVFGANFSALIMQPYANNLDFAAEAVPFNYGTDRPILSPSWVIPEISTDYHFGFDVGIEGMFHMVNTRMSLNWVRYHSPTDTGSKSVAHTNNMVGPFFEIGPDASAYKTSKGEVYFNFDQVNLDYGTFVKFGDHLEMNLGCNVSYARVYEHLFTRFTNVPGTVIRTLTVPSTFQGWGPGANFDFVYTIVKGFKFVGDARGTLFVGTFKNETAYSTTSPSIETLGDTNPNTQSTTVGNKMGIVPAFEGKLGLAYEWTWGDYCEFKLEGGYRAQVHINAIRSIDMGSEVALGAIGSIGSAETGVYARSFLRTVSDFSLAGPYVAVNIGF